MSNKRRILVFLSIALTPVLVVAAMLVLANIGSVNASSHREAPAISKDAFADNTDTYVWIPAGQTERIALAASYIPFEGPEGGPNYYEWDDSVRYNIFVSNDGDPAPEVTYTLSSRTEVQNPDTFLYNTGPITTLDDADWNRRQFITVTETFEPGVQPGPMAAAAPDAHETVIVDGQLTAPANIGSKSTPDWDALREEATYTYMDDNSDMVTVYGGQTDDAFWVDLQVFDLLTLRGQAPPIGYEMGNNVPVDSVSGFNVHSLILELPISRLVRNEETVLGVWATAERSSMPVMGEGAEGFTQVSRLGMPLVNEVVIPMGLKDVFNTLTPSDDLGAYGLLQESVENPEVGTLLCALYGVPLPEDSDDDCNTEYTDPGTGRGDIFQIFLTGMVLQEPFTVNTAGGPVTLPAGFNVNQPAGAVPSEMIRINTAISGDTCAPEPSRLGVLGGDACGFPNGRRPLDDTVEIELLAVAGAAYDILDDGDEAFAFNADLIGVLDDGVDENDLPFNSDFPYFANAQSGQEHFHQNATEAPLSLSFGNFTVPSSSAPWLQLAAAGLSIGFVGALELLRRRRQSR